MTTDDHQDTSPKDAGPQDTDGFGRHGATDLTRERLAAFAETLPADDPADMDRATRGYIDRRDGEIQRATPAPFSTISWDTHRWDFIEGDCPDTVNPSLWRHAKLNGQHGLFEVKDGMYQVRGYDTSVVTFIRGDRGWVVIDPLTIQESAAVAYGLVREHLEDVPVTTVIYTHSHIDHYGGILGMVTREQLDAGEVEIVAPEGFLEAAVAENVAAQAVMGRRATYQYGLLLPWEERGHVDQGLAKGIPLGTSALVPPTIEIRETGTELVLDGIRIEFQITPDTEAPAEMHFYFPDFDVLCLAENCTGTQHNVLTLRGAVVRDALGWSRYIDEAIVRYGDRLTTTIASHSWPRFGRQDALTHMRNQRDLYRWLHDEAMRLANKGYTPDEISEEVALPDGLWEDWSCHGYYGTVSHNVRAVYQRYLGFYDGHPSSLEPYPPVDAGKRYVEFMGGIDALMANARKSFDAGDYRWVAEVLRHAVFADPSHQGARSLQADAFEQLGYAAEAGPWRDVYLMGASELRNGTPEIPMHVRPRPEVASGMTVDQLFDYLSMALNGPQASTLAPLNMRWMFSDGSVADVELSNGTLHTRTGELAAKASPPDALVIECDRQVLEDLLWTRDPITDRIADESLMVSGEASLLVEWWELLDDFQMFFPIIEP